MPNQLNKLTIKGFKSIRSLEDFELKSLNVLIGANGAGKSNFIDFFRLLRAMLELPLPELDSSNLKSYIADSGGSDDFLFNGPKVTKKIEAEMYFGPNGYRFQLSPTADEAFTINKEAELYTKSSDGWKELGSGQLRPGLLRVKNRLNIIGEPSDSSYVYDAIASWKIYHFHDTSKLAPMRRSEITEDNAYLRFDASNIAPFLLNLLENHRETYTQIIDTIRIVTPFFDDFVLVPKNGKVRLQWHQKGSDYPLKPQHLSDGTIRFICLTTALLQPVMPSTVILDEPELGLHPYAIEILAELIKAASQRSQVIVSTQSPALIDCFEPIDVVVVDRINGASTFTRLQPEDLLHWLEDYSLGELWRKNVISGGPKHE